MRESSDFSIKEIDKKLAELRVAWRKYPKKRKIIERQAKALMYSKRGYRFPEVEKHESRVSEVIDNLI